MCAPPIQVKSKTLQVEEYVLPKFDVKIDSSEHFNVKDGKVRAIIRSKYTYGKLVKGRATITVKPMNYLAWSTRRETDTVAKTIAIDGKGTVEFDITDDLHIQPDEFKRSTTYALSVVVVEELTGMLLLEILLNTSSGYFLLLFLFLNVNKNYSMA